jgi:hypothetical protein
MAVKNLDGEDFDRMKKKPSPWMIAVGAFAFLAMAAYLLFALTLADHWGSAPVPPDKTEAPKLPM